MTTSSSKESLIHLRQISSRGKIIFVGPPNVGKTTLFNQLTGARQRVINYPGSTVHTFSKRMALSKDQERHFVELVDTPGVTSSLANSKDEELTLTLLNKHTKQDLIAFVACPWQLGKHLVLFRQLQRAFSSASFVFILNKKSCSKSSPVEVDGALLAKKIGVEVLEVDLSSPKSLKLFKDDLTKDFLDKRAQRKVGSEQKTPDTARSFSPFSVNGSLGTLSKRQLTEDFKWAEAIVVEVAGSHLKKRKREQGFFLDRFFLHPLFGSLSFIAFMGLFFWSIFGLAAPLMEGVETALFSLGESLTKWLPDNLFGELISEGLFTAFSAVFVFVPQLVILFFSLGIMEASGFLARGAVLIDKPLSFLGLSGRSFLPLLSGHACAIPALMAARAIPNKKERIITQMMIPLMTCSARIPVYGLLLSLLLPYGSAWTKGLSMTALYMVSFLVAALVAALLGRFLPKKNHKGLDFYMELPPWRLPRIRDVVSQTLRQTLSFLKGAGPNILWISLGLWLVSSFPSKEHPLSYTLGKYVEPLVEPLGLDWRVAVALFCAFAAREVFVSTLAVIFAFNQGAGEVSGGLLQSLQGAIQQSTGETLFTPSSICGLLLFFMLALQCMATVAVAKKEMGGSKAAVSMAIGYTAFAYLASLALVQGMRFLGIA